MAEAVTRRGRRTLTEAERVLWKGVTASIRPLRAAAAVPVEIPAPDSVSVPGAQHAAAAPRASPPRPVTAPPLSPPLAPPLAPLGRRLRQKVARGGTDIEARLDLHGLTQDRAHASLLGFLRSAQARALKVVLVITGKGARGGGDGSERGVLKRVVPRWLALPEFRAYVIGFEPAHAAHGGDGALYVRVRRKR